MDAEEPVQYSLGQPSQKTGIGGISLKGTVILAIGFMFFLFAQMAGQVVLGFMLLPVTGVVMLFFVLNIGNRSIADNLTMIYQDLDRTSRGEHLYISGALSKIPGGHHKLPGLYARTEALEAQDIYGRNFVMILDRPRREVTVVLRCDLTGQTAMTQADRNAMTAEWSRFLASMSLSGDIEQVVSVVSTRPGSGALVEREVESIIHPDAPEIAKIIMREAATAISYGRPEIEAHVSITVKIDSGQLKDNAFIENLSSRVATWADQLQWAGMVAEPMTYDQAVAKIHGFYNPAAEADFEELAQAGISHGISWDNAGASYAMVAPGFYDHDGCRSVTWEMKEAPRSIFEDTILTGLAAPHERIIRKRLAIVYRPYEAGKGASRVEAEHRDAMVAANSSRKITSAKAELRLEHTEAARRAQARGAQLGQYSLFVTATTTDPAELNRISQDMMQLGAGASIRLQPMRRQQDVGFATTCGFGQTPWTVTEKKWSQL